MSYIFRVIITVLAYYVIGDSGDFTGYLTGKFIGYGYPNSTVIIDYFYPDTGPSLLVVILYSLLNHFLFLRFIQVNNIPLNYAFSPTLVFFTSLPGKEQLLGGLFYLFASNINQFKLILLGIFRPFYLLVSIQNKYVYGFLILFTVLFFADFHLDIREIWLSRGFLRSDANTYLDLGEYGPILGSGIVNFGVSTSNFFVLLLSLESCILISRVLFKNPRILPKLIFSGLVVTFGVWNYGFWLRSRALLIPIYLFLVYASSTHSNVFRYRRS